MIELIPAALRAHAALGPYREILSALSAPSPAARERAGVRAVDDIESFAVRGFYSELNETALSLVGASHHATALTLALSRAAGEEIVPRFIAPLAGHLSAIDFERRIVEQNELIVRPNSLHDALNALVWLTFPKTKRAISEAHVVLGVNANGKTRPRRRDVLTLFDESGIIILSENDDLRSLNQQHQWRELFVTNRTDFIQQTRPILFGHGAMEQLANGLSQLPQVHRGLTVKALWLPLPVSTTRAQLDGYLAERVVSGERLNEHERSIPMPVLGLPGWFLESESPDCYDDESVFRPRRSKIN